MSTMTAPPNSLVRLGRRRNSKRAEPHPSNMFFVGTAEHGLLEQGRGLGDFATAIGARTTYSGLRDDALAALNEAGATLGSPWTASIVYGPAAVRASKTFNDSQGTPAPSIKVVAKEPGAYANAFKVRITTPASNTRKVQILRDGVVVASSPTTGVLADLEEWSDANDIVDIEILGAQLPKNTTTGTDDALAGGNDDRAGINTAAWVAACARIDKKEGPGLLYVDTTDPDVKAAVRAHCLTVNRIPFFKFDRGTSIADLLSEQVDLRGDTPDLAMVGGSFAGYGFSRPISSEPRRRPSAAALQLGLQSWVLRNFGIRKTAFGPTNSPLTTCEELDQEFTDDERSQLYAGGVNVLTDDDTIATWGYATGSLDPLDQDLHHQIVRMWLLWEFQPVMNAAIGQAINSKLKASTHASLKAICEKHRLDGVFNWEDFGDLGYVIDVESVNTPETAANREFYALVSIRHAATADFSELLVMVNTSDAPTI